MNRRSPPGRRKSDGMPTPDDLVGTPELAILAALAWTLDLVTRTLVCAYPELTDPERPYWLCQASPIATAAETSEQSHRSMGNPGFLIKFGDGITASPSPNVTKTALSR